MASFLVFVIWTRIFISTCLKLFAKAVEFTILENERFLALLEQPFFKLHSSTYINIA